jgi:hypothetical protein
MSDGRDLSEPADLPGPLFSVTAAQEIPKPKNWQDFQRGCVVLFQAELKDPHAQEYGRHGQKQRGIDILGRRNGDPNHFVGIQCRRYVDPLKKADILKDCRDALAIILFFRPHSSLTISSETSRSRLTGLSPYTRNLIAEACG